MDVRFTEHRAEDYRLEAVWTLARSSGPDVAPHYVPPDGSIDVLVRWSGRDEPRVLVHAPSLCFHLADIPAEDRLLGIRFKPGVAGPLLGLSDETRRHLGSALSSDGIAIIDVERIAVQLAERIGTPPALVTEYIAAVEEERGGTQVGRVLEKMSAHTRALQRGAATWLAMTPKSFVRVVRIRAAARGILHGEPLADIAADLGFADQAHLTRDFHEQMGAPPSKWRLSHFFKTPSPAAHNSDGTRGAAHE